MQLLFSARETIATLVKYKCKTFITLTPGLLIRAQSNWVAVDFTVGQAVIFHIYHFRNDKSIVFCVVSIQRKLELECFIEFRLKIERHLKTKTYERTDLRQHFS